MTAAIRHPGRSAAKSRDPWIDGSLQKLLADVFGHGSRISAVALSGMTEGAA